MLVSITHGVHHPSRQLPLLPTTLVSITRHRVHHSLVSITRHRVHHWVCPSSLSQRVRAQLHPHTVTTQSTPQPPHPNHHHYLCADDDAAIASKASLQQVTLWFLWSTTYTPLPFTQPPSPATTPYSSLLVNWVTGVPYAPSITACASHTQRFHSLHSLQPQPP